jgi:hypothetical protein
LVRAFININKRLKQVRYIKTKISELQYEIDDTSEEEELEKLG